MSREELRREVERGREIAPFGFVSISPKAMVQDFPVLHDKLDMNCFTGEIDCELTTLTPTLAGNYQYEVGAAIPNLQKHIAEEIESRLGKQPDASYRKKKIIEPLMMNCGGQDRVVISASATNGMLKNSLAALLSAPMERVKERTMSFRPNAVVINEESPKLDFEPVVVVAADNSSGMMKVAFLSDDPGPRSNEPHSVVFVSGNSNVNPVAGLKPGLDEFRSNLKLIEENRAVGKRMLSLGSLNEKPTTP